MEFNVNIIDLFGPWTEERKQKLTSAVTALEAAMNSVEFKEAFMNTEFKQLPSDQKKMTKEELFEEVMSPPLFNYHIRHKSWWKRFTSAIGWTADDHSTKGLDIFTYVDVFDRMSVVELASHIGHEMTHLKGFSHSFKWTRERDDSLPYAVGRIISQVSKLSV